MAKATYYVVPILPRRSQGHFAFNRGVAANAQGEDLDSDKLLISVTVDANSKTDAEVKVRAQYQKHSINQAATVRLE